MSGQVKLDLIRHKGEKSKAKRQKILGNLAIRFFMTTLDPQNFLKPYLTFEAEFHYLRDGQLMTIAVSNLPELIKSGQIVPVTQSIEPFEKLPCLSDEGVEIINLPDKVKKYLSCYQRCDAKTQSKLRQLIRETMQDFVSAHFGMPAVALDTIYRDTNPSREAGFRGVNLVHKDFLIGHEQGTLDSFEDTWAPRVNETLGTATAYHASNMAGPMMINIWMPINLHLSSDPLVILPKDAVLPIERTFPYDAVRADGSKFKAVSLTAPEATRQDGWKFYHGLGLGKAYVFLSFETAHTAVERPYQGANDRQSIEMRFCLFHKDFHTKSTETDTSLDF